MARHIDWYGRIAILGAPTGDGRILTGMAQERFHVPVLYRTSDALVAHLGFVDRLRAFGGLNRRWGTVWANLVLDIDLIPSPEVSLYPEPDVDRDLALKAVWLGPRPAWAELTPVIYVDGAS